VFEHRGVKIKWLGHDGYRLSNGKTVYIDPYQIKEEGRADLLLITHEHFDHLSLDDIRRVVTPDTVVVTIPLCEHELGKVRVREVRTVAPGDHVEVDGVPVDAVPAYNLNKFRAPGQVFHPRQDGRVGFVVTLNGVRIYHAGDADAIPEMSNLKVDVALLPVSGTYVMTAEEAAEAVTRLKPKVAIPMHYGAIVGSEADAQRFKQLAKCDVRILTIG
jgi:L-ascorbate metabolism protein UlaG (beta-lactamase superfamily)